MQTISKELQEIKTILDRVNGHNNHPVETTTTISRSETGGDVMEVSVTHTPRSASSVEFSVDSKGNIKPNIKVYHEDPQEAYKIATELTTKAVAYANKLSA